MGIKSRILSANASGSLLSDLCSRAYVGREDVIDTLAALHNSGQINFPAVCRSDQLDSISGHSFFVIQQFFCETLPRIDCDVRDAVETSAILFERAGNDMTAGFVFEALREWFAQRLERTENGLRLIWSNPKAPPGVAHSVLLAGARHDVRKYAIEALDLTRQPHSPARLGAIAALGGIRLDQHEDLLLQAVHCLEEAIEIPSSDSSAASAIQAALELLGRIGPSRVDLVEPLVLKASARPAVNTICVITRGLQINHTLYTEDMVDTSLSAIAEFDKHVPVTIDQVDSMLYHWDIDGDRQRILRFLARLLGPKGETAFDFSKLKSFSHKMRESRGDILGWYVVSLLLTGRRELCSAALELLPYNRVPDGFDIDLSEFSLDGTTVLFLCKKIIGYLLSHRPWASALLLSCFRAVSSNQARQLEDTVLTCFLINHPSAIDWFKEHASAADQAHAMVKRLERRVKSYLKELGKHGICSAFRPSEREYRYQQYKQFDLIQGIQSDALRGSIVSQIAHRSVVLYGTGTIYYMHTNDESGPHRQEARFGSFQQTIEIPRLTVFDPVGLDFALSRFRAEPPPS